MHQTYTRFTLNDYFFYYYFSPVNFNFNLFNDFYIDECLEKIDLILLSYLKDMSSFMFLDILNY